MSSRTFRQLVDATYQELGYSHFTHDGLRYDLNRLLRLTADTPVVAVPTQLLSWVLEYDQPDPERVARADPSVPVLVARDRTGRLVAVDGLHRLAKAVKQGLLSIPAKNVSATQLEQSRLKHSV